MHGKSKTPGLHFPENLGIHQSKNHHSPREKTPKVILDQDTEYHMQIQHDSAGITTQVTRWPFRAALTALTCFTKQSHIQLHRALIPPYPPRWLWQVFSENLFKNKLNPDESSPQWHLKNYTHFQFLWVVFVLFIYSSLTPFTHRQPSTVKPSRKTQGKEEENGRAPMEPFQHQVIYSHTNLFGNV